MPPEVSEGVPSTPSNDEIRYHHLITGLNACLEITRSLDASGPDPMGATFCIRSANAYALNLFGASAVDELLAQQLCDLIPVEGGRALNTLLANAFVRPDTSVVEGIIRTLDGHLVATRMTVSPWTSESALLLFAIVERAGSTCGPIPHCNASLADAGFCRPNDASPRDNAKLAGLAREAPIDELMASLVHEITQPLSSINVSSGTALKWLMKDPPDIARAVRRIECVMREAERTATMVRGMHKLAQGGRGSQAIVELNQVTREAVALVEDDARGRNVHLQLKCFPATLLVLADPVQLQQVIINLVTNAIQAAVQGDAETRLVEVRTTYATDGFIELTVSDTGTGIAVEHLARVFESFFTTKSDGVGLGLAICKSIIEHHSGTLSLENVENGKGAVARIRLESVNGSGAVEFSAVEPATSAGDSEFSLPLVLSERSGAAS